MNENGNVDDNEVKMTINTNKNQLDKNVMNNNDVMMTNDLDIENNEIKIQTIYDY